MQGVVGRRTQKPAITMHFCSGFFFFSFPFVGIWKRERKTTARRKENTIATGTSKKGTHRQGKSCSRARTEYNERNWILTQKTLNFCSDKFNKLYSTNIVIFLILVGGRCLWDACVIMCENSVSVVEHVFCRNFSKSESQVYFFRSLPDTQIFVVSMNEVGWRAVLFVLLNLIFEIDYLFVWLLVKLIENCRKILVYDSIYSPLQAVVYSYVTYLFKTKCAGQMVWFCNYSVS